MEDIEKELEQKSIERDTNVELQINEVEPEPVVEPVTKGTNEKKSKKVRSQKQIEAFEKARIKRAEAIANRKKLKEEEKLQKKENKKQVTIQEKPPPSGVLNQEPSVSKPVVSTPHPREQVIQNHYYYYGVPPPLENTKTKKKKKSKRPPTPSSSESESEEDTERQPLHNPPQVQQQPQYYQTPKPSYKFSYT